MQQARHARVIHVAARVVEDRGTKGGCDALLQTRMHVGEFRFRVRIEGRKHWQRQFHGRTFTPSFAVLGPFAGIPVAIHVRAPPVVHIESIRNMIRHETEFAVRIPAFAADTGVQEG